MQLELALQIYIARLQSGSELSIDTCYEKAGEVLDYLKTKEAQPKAKTWQDRLREMEERKRNMENKEPYIEYPNLLKP